MWSVCSSSGEGENLNFAVPINLACSRLRVASGPAASARLSMLRHRLALKGHLAARRDRR